MGNQDVKKNLDLDAVLAEVEDEVKKGSFPSIPHGMLDIQMYGAGDEKEIDE